MTLENLKNIIVQLILSFLKLIGCVKKDDTTLIAFYPFNGNALDESGNGNDGQPQNGASLTTDRFGSADNAYAFDGEDDHIIVPTGSLNLPIAGSLSLAAWVYPESQKTQNIIRKGPVVNGPEAAPFALAMSGTGDIIFELRPNAQLTQVRKTGYSLHNWTYIVGTYDGTTMRLYVNGQLENSMSTTGTLAQEISPLLIGTRLGLPSDTFEGKIDDVRIYNRALTEDEIRQLYEE